MTRFRSAFARKAIEATRRRVLRNTAALASKQAAGLAAARGIDGLCRRDGFEGARADSEVASIHGVVADPRTLNGGMGTSIIADVTALHPGSPSKAGSRHVPARYGIVLALGQNH